MPISGYETIVLTANDRQSVERSHRALSKNAQCAGNNISYIHHTSMLFNATVPSSSFWTHWLRQVPWAVVALLVSSPTGGQALAMPWGCTNRFPHLLTLVKAKMLSRRMQAVRHNPSRHLSIGACPAMSQRLCCLREHYNWGLVKMLYANTSVRVNSSFVSE